MTNGAEQAAKVGRGDVRAVGGFPRDGALAEQPWALAMPRFAPFFLDLRLQGDHLLLGGKISSSDGVLKSHELGEFGVVAVDLRHLEENMQGVVKPILDQSIKSTLPLKEGSLLSSTFLEKELLHLVDHQPIFSYIDNGSNPSYALMLQLREILVDHALKTLEEEEKEKDVTPYFKASPTFEALEEIP
ncbi:hypothetical protein L7F22_003948 [Adiantum nelumboides]|nr:hypothetical protein [Adiantum nelumboides]